MASGQPKQTHPHQRDPANNKLLSLTDALGKLASVMRLVGTPQSLTQTLTHERAFARLALRTDPLNTITRFLANGRRTAIGGSYAQSDLPAAISTATYNAANQLTKWGSATLSYDANGNLLTDGSLTHGWNARNQMASLSGAAAASFQYDALGRRIVKTVAGTATGFLHDGINPVQELTGSTPKANLLTGLGVDEIFSRTDASGARHLLTDGGNRGQIKITTIQNRASDHAACGRR